MTAEQYWRRTVRHHLGLGRFLPLGGPRDGCWIAESVTETVLQQSVAGNVEGVRLGSLRLTVADPGTAHEPVVPPPPTALPPGPLRMSAEFSARPTEPLPNSAARLRAALAAASAERLGLVVTEIDLRVTGLVLPDDPADEPQPLPPWKGPLDEALSGVPGVLGGTVRREDRPGPNALPRPHARVEVAVRADLRTLDVAREVRTAVRRLEGSPTAAVLVIAVG